MLGPNGQLVLGQNHPVALHSPELGLAQRAAVGHDRAGPGHRHGLAGGYVGRAADDLRGLAFADVHPAHGEPVGIGVLLGAQDATHHELLRCAHAVVVDRLDLGPGHGQSLGQRLCVQLWPAVLVEPLQGDPHQNCSRKRMSFSNNTRRSGTPCLSMAIRSIPMPNAKPWTRSGS